MNSIKNIEIKNFKSIRQIKIEDCRRINVFVGYPNTGKSNLLEAIGLYSSFKEKDEHFKFSDIARVKNFSELFFNRDYRNSTNVIINKTILLELIINQANELEIRSRIKNDQIENEHTLFSAIINTSDFIYRNSRPVIDADIKSVVAPIRKYEFNAQGVINQKKSFALSIPFGVNLLDILQRDSNLRKEVAGLFDNYNLKLFIDEGEIKFLKYLNDDTGISIPYHQVADTLRRLIFYKAAILSNRESVLLFEEPEAHMFPPYISKFTADAMYDKNDNQFFINTHSPFVINDFMENLKKEDLSIYVVGYKKEAGETVVRRLTENELHEMYQYGIDLYMNLENFLIHEQQ